MQWYMVEYRKRKREMQFTVFLVLLLFLRKWAAHASHWDEWNVNFLFYVREHSFLLPISWKRRLLQIQTYTCCLRRIVKFYRTCGLTWRWNKIQYIIISILLSSLGEFLGRIHFTKCDGRNTRETESQERNLVYSGGSGLRLN